MLNRVSISLTRVFFIFLLAGKCFAGTHFILQGSANDSNLGLNHEDSRSGSVSIAQDLGNYFRIGLTHRQGLTTIKGYKANATNEYNFYEQRIHSMANSLDFMVVLYYGEIFVPYVQLGAIKKDYIVRNFGPLASDNTVNTYALPMEPSTGLGLGIKLSTHFSLKLSYTVSPGIKQVDPNLPPESALDSYLAVGISYDI